MLPDGSELDIVKDAAALSVLLGDALHIFDEWHFIILVARGGESGHAAQDRERGIGLSRAMLILDVVEKFGDLLAPHIDEVQGADVQVDVFATMRRISPAVRSLFFSTCRISRSSATAAANPAEPEAPRTDLAGLDAADHFARAVARLGDRHFGGRANADPFLLAVMVPRDHCVGAEANRPHADAVLRQFRVREKIRLARLALKLAHHPVGQRLAALPPAHRFGHFRVPVVGTVSRFRSILLT